MGPRPNGRGKSMMAAAMNAMIKRQWGRGQTAAESRKISDIKSLKAELRQWGRGQTAAESGVLAEFHHHGAASMGPRPNGRGKADQFDSDRHHKPLASMGPRPNGRGKAKPLVRPVDCLGASMGPRPNGRGKW